MGEMATAGGIVALGVMLYTVVFAAGLGLMAAPLALVCQVLVVFGVDVPLILFLPNLPFELGAGL